MADRRMLHRKVVESDSFYNLSEGAQAIYTHLTINADEDGFINGAKSIVSRFKRGDLRLKELVDKRFVLQFGDVYVIKHWRIGNSLKSATKAQLATMASGETLPSRKPDVDNVQKVVLDALNGVAYKDDARVVALHGYKQYSMTPGLLVEIEEFGGT